MFLLQDVHFVLCSLEGDILHAQRIMGIFYLSYPQINKVGKSDHMVAFVINH